MNAFTSPDFQNRLTDTIAELEQATQIEVVVLIKHKSANYDDVPMGLGAIFTLLTFSLLFFIDTDISDYTLYFATLLAFALGVALGLLTTVQRLFCSKKRKTRNVEIMARALFQKGGLHHTSSKIGTLIYISLLEKMAYLLPDRGAEMAIPTEEWQALNLQFQAVFQAKKPHESLLLALKNCNDTFHRYIPALDTNENELPNDLKVDL